MRIPNLTHLHHIRARSNNTIDTRSALAREIIKTGRCVDSLEPD